MSTRSSNPILNPSTLIPKNEQSNLENPIKVLKTPKKNPANTPDPWGLSANPLVGRKSSLQRDGERIRERGNEIPEAEIIRILIKKTEAEIRQEESSTSKQQQSPRSNSLELPPRPNTLEQQPQPKPRDYEQKPKSLKQQQPTSSSLKQPREQQTSPRRERRSRGRSEMGESASSYCSTRSFFHTPKVNPSQSFQSKALSSLSTINHNLTTLEANHDVNTSKLLVS
ncbi:hypothetical protein KEM48_006855 [Puccinia striiformis f. sp. tritici PST-130]|nr:hypothetical protein KEM48_006855 [Puccinia striiformis f. sp. tritici PST-130]